MHTSLSTKLRQLQESAIYQEESQQLQRRIALAEKIHGRRKDIGISQKELAQRVQTTQRIISHLEHALYAPTNGIGETLYIRLADALNIHSEYLFSDAIHRPTFELLGYLSQQKNYQWDSMQFMQISHLIDRQLMETSNRQLTAFKYPPASLPLFDKNIYLYQWILQDIQTPIQIQYIQPHLSLINHIIAIFPLHNDQNMYLIP